jgi:2-oxoglutarate dehydrogenase E1 component
VSEPVGATSSFGPNAWLVDEMYERFVADPDSVGASWKEFFADYRPEMRTGQVPAVGTAPLTAPSPPSPPPAPTATAASATPASESEAAEPLRGAAARIVLNMEASLGVPTATSFRDVPAKLLEVNRRIINGYLGRTRGGKVSFTHLIGYAVVQAFESMPVMKSSYALVDGKPGVIRHEHVNLGLAVDVEKSDGGRTLLVPAIKRGPSSGPTRSSSASSTPPTRT